MVSETFLGAYFWGVYVWFVVGALLIGIPAIFEMSKTLRSTKNGGKTGGM